MTNNNNNTNKIWSTPEYNPTEYKLILSNIQYSTIENLQRDVSNIPQHPHLLSPHLVVAISKQRVWAHYKVSTRGMTLRNWVNLNVLHKPNNNNNNKHRNHSNHRNLRITLSNIKTQLFHNKITPYDIILPLIECYEFMLNNNLLLSQSSINPDFIWVDYDEHGKLVVFAINTLETLAVNYYGTVDSDKNYWSPELLGKYNHATFYANPNDFAMAHELRNGNGNGNANGIQPQGSLNSNSMTKLKRYNTRPSTLSCVYSLGLVFYFIVAKHDPFPEQRIHVLDRPEIDVIKYSINPIFAKRIWTATEPELNNRPTMNDWKESILGDLNADLSKRSCILL